MNKENSVLGLAQTKIHADSEKYFSLFDRHVPSLGKGRTVLLYSIDNVDCVMKLAAKNPEASYVVYGNPLMNRMVEKLLPGARTIDETPENRKKYNIDMNFDCIIMNPPYERNLHLKILAEAIKHLNDENSKVVNLSPTLWIEDPHAHLKRKSNFFKFKKSISEKLIALDFIDAKTSSELFNISLYANLGVYACGKNSINIIDTNNIWKRNYSKFEIELFEKIYNTPKHLDTVCENNMRDGIRVLIAFIAGNRGALPVYKDLDYVIDGMKNGKDWTKCKNNGGYEKAEGMPMPCSIKFNTEPEALNFYNSCKTTFYKFISTRYLLDQHIPLYFLPFMEDYAQPWTDERFKAFFSITDEEWKYIEETMAKYVKK